MSQLDQFRAQKDDFFQHDWQSPLEADQRAGFQRLEILPGKSRAASHRPARGISRQRNRHDDHQHRQCARVSEVWPFLV